MDYTLLLIFSQTCHFCNKFIENDFTDLCVKMKEHKINITTIYINSVKDTIVNKINSCLSDIIVAVPMFVLIPNSEMYNQNGSIEKIIPFGWIKFNGLYQQITNVVYTSDYIFKWTIDTINNTQNLNYENYQILKPREFSIKPNWSEY